MAFHEDVVIIIPSRMGSRRLKNKPLIDIDGVSVIERVCLRALETGIKNIYVTTDSEEIARITQKHVRVIMTSPKHKTGTDRIFEAYTLMQEREKFKYIVNLQGDMPYIKKEVILGVIDALKSSGCSISTAAAKIDKDAAQNSSNVKVVLDNQNNAMYFSRSPIPFGAKEYLYHIGIYGFMADAIGCFVNLKQSALELSENLEQLRALENKMLIKVYLSDSTPISIDTPEDLDQLKKS